MTRRPGDDLKDDRAGALERTGPGAECVCVPIDIQHMHIKPSTYTQKTHSRVLSHLTVSKSWINLWSRHQSVLVFVHASVYSTTEWPHKYFHTLTAREKDGSEKHKNPELHNSKTLPQRLWVLHCEIHCYKWTTWLCVINVGPTWKSQFPYPANFQAGKLSGSSCLALLIFQQHKNHLLDLCTLIFTGFKVSVIWLLHGAPSVSLCNIAQPYPTIP